MRGTYHVELDAIGDGLVEMAGLAGSAMGRATPALLDADLQLAESVLEQDDDRMDELHRTLFQHLLDERWKHGVETAVDVTLVGRYYERDIDRASRSAVGWSTWSSAST